MSADENVIEGLKTICEKNAPELIGLPTTGLSETQGTDIHRLVKRVPRAVSASSPHIAVVPVNTPDYTGSPGIRLRAGGGGDHRHAWCPRQSAPSAAATGR